MSDSLPPNANLPPYVLKHAAESLIAEHARLAAGEIARIEIPLHTQTDLLAWLAAQKQAPRLGYWRDRDDGSEIAACGVSDVVRAPTWHDMKSGVTAVTRRLAHATDSVRYFGGLRFEAERGGDTVWDGWGGCEFGLPACGIEKNSRSTLFFAQAVAGSEKSLHAALHFISSLSTHIRAPQQTSADELTVTPLPSREDWEKTLAAALADIASGALQKIVLARRVHITWSAPRCPFSALASLRALEPHCFCYAAFGTESVFLGASPELLYHRDSATLCTEAVAGSAKTSDGHCDDRSDSQSLASSKKNLHEHTIVRDWIVEKLSPLSVAPPRPGTLEIRKLHSVQHLVTPITTQLRADITDATLLRVLHPTPAVAGRPRDAVLRWIARHEPFERGWYAAPVGWISRQRAKFIVALRCAMLKNNEAHLYSGAGIVSGSDPAQEWEELDNKTATLRKAIGQSWP